ncbi:MAG: hypothetical protein HY892_21465 [Deltaproteobacteria bacterium]|nr:hypothetical protein [Deltaproteobacteria bacterium]
MFFKKNKKSARAIMLNLSGVLLILGFGGKELWGASPSGTPEIGGPDRNPFAYPSKIIKELTLLKTGDGKTPAEAKRLPKEYALSGILWTDKGGVAAINRRIFQEGELLDEYCVWRIDRNKVILKKEGEEIVLNLFQSPVVISEHRAPRSPQEKKFR